jgi:hypothetical protein
MMAVDEQSRELSVGTKVLYAGEHAGEVVQVTEDIYDGSDDGMASYPVAVLGIRLDDGTEFPMISGHSSWKHSEMHGDDCFEFVDVEVVDV